MKGFIKKWVLPPGFVALVNRARMSARMLHQRAGDGNLLRETRRLEGIHKGARCFILGAGSSIAVQNLRKLRDEYVISVSNTFVHPDYPIFEPKYHVTPHMLFGHSKYYDESRFVDWLMDMERKTGKAELFFHIGDKGMIDRAGLFKGRTIHWVEYGPWTEQNGKLELSNVPYIWSVSELAITVAIYLGFDQIYLLGIDHDWFVGPQVYFYDQAKEHALKPHLIDLGIDAEYQMRRHADIFKKYKYLYSIRQNIFNANSNPNHYLDVFPKVDFDSLFPAGKEGGSCAG